MNTLFDLLCVGNESRCRYHTRKGFRLSSHYIELLLAGVLNLLLDLSLDLLLGILCLMLSRSDLGLHIMLNWLLDLLPHLLLNRLNWLLNHFLNLLRARNKLLSLLLNTLSLLLNLALGLVELLTS